MILTLIIVGWLICAVLTAGMWFAEFQGKFPEVAQKNRRSDLGEAILIGLVFGPLGLVAEFFTSGFAEHGWRLW